MARLIEVLDLDAVPSSLTLSIDDVLLLHAAGARVVSGADSVELLGPYVPALVTGAREVLSPSGLPSTVLVRARRPGIASIAIIRGNSFPAPQAVEIEISVPG